MATTRIWKVTDRLDHVISYVSNKAKTNNGKYVTGINCLPQTAMHEMNIVKQQFNKTDGIIGYHAYQSFSGYEVDSNTAHEIGIKLAEELWGDRFQVIVTTHTNTKNVHNHFAINSVSFVDGKKYYNNKNTYALMRETSDNICREYGLLVLNERSYYKKRQENYKANDKYTNLVKEDIDFAIGQAVNYKDFINILQQMGYETFIKGRNETLSVRKEPYKRNIRIERAIGQEYSKNMLITRIHHTKAVKVPFPEAYSLVGRYKSKRNVRTKKKAKGLRALYLYYCYLLRVFPKYNATSKLSPAMREEVKKMEEISNEARFLAKTGIQTSTELNDYIETKSKELNTLKGQRENLWQKEKYAKTDDEKFAIYSEIQKLKSKIDELNTNIKLCKNIEIRSNQMKENIKIYNNKKNIKSKVKNRSFLGR